MTISFFYTNQIDCRYASMCCKHDPENCIENHKGTLDKPDCFKPANEIMDFGDFRTYMQKKIIEDR